MPAITLLDTSRLNCDFAVGNLIACVNSRPANPMGGATQSAILGTVVIGDVLELKEVRLSEQVADGSVKEFQAETAEWRPHLVILRSSGLEIERAAEGNVLVQRGTCPGPRTFSIHGRASSVFQTPGDFHIKQDLGTDMPSAALVFRSETGWYCVMAAAPSKVLDWKADSPSAGQFRFQSDPTKEFQWVVAADRDEASARKSAREALLRPEAVFENSRQGWEQFFVGQVPAYPFADERWKSLYDLCWYVLRGNRTSYGATPLAKPFTCPSKFTYRHQWLWDSVFASLGLRWLHDKTDALEQFDNILSHPCSDGMLPHELYHHPTPAKRFWSAGEGCGSTVAAPPILGMGIEKVFESSKNLKLIESAFPVLKRSVEWFFKELDADKDGLVALRHTHESSWDNSPRWDEAMQEGRRLRPVETVDTNCLLVCELKRLAQWARLLGKREEAGDFEARALRTAEAIRATLWDEKEQFFYDVDEASHRKMNVKSPAAFFTLWADIATAKQEQALISHLTDPREFWTRYPVPSVARNERSFSSRDMFRGPTWANINWVVIHGLRQRGHVTLAKELVTRTLEMMLAQGAPAVREWYDPDTGEAHGSLNYGWSAGVGIDLMMDGLQGMVDG